MTRATGANPRDSEEPGGPGSLSDAPRPQTTVVLVTVAMVVLTHNLVDGGAAGVVYAVSGELFFASTNDLVHQFDVDSVKVGRVAIDLSEARVWDTSAVAALDAVVPKFEERGIHSELVGLDEHAAELHGSKGGKLRHH